MIRNICVCLSARSAKKIDQKSAVSSLIVTEAGIGYRMENAEIAPLYEQGEIKLLG